VSRTEEVDMEIKKLTTRWLKKQEACSDAIEWFESQKETDPIKIIKKLIRYDSDEKLQWANWFIVRLMNKKQNVQYAIFAAELALCVFEKAYPNDDRPRKAIEAAKAYLKNPCEKTKSAARSAASAAEFAAWSAESAAESAAWSAASAAWSAASAAGNCNGTLTRILRYGIKIIEGHLK